MEARVRAPDKFFFSFQKNEISYAKGFALPFHSFILLYTKFR